MTVVPSAFARRRMALAWSGSYAGQARAPACARDWWEHKIRARSRPGHRTPPV